MSREAAAFVVAAASDLGACVCEDDATVSELDDLQARVAELEAERDAAISAVGEPCAECGHIDWRCDPNPLLERAEAAEARVRVQAEQIAALQEALKRIASGEAQRKVIGESAIFIDGRATTAQLTRAVSACEIAREALALAEGCATPADEKETR